MHITLLGTGAFGQMFHSLFSQSGHTVSSWSYRRGGDDSIYEADLILSTLSTTGLSVISDRLHGARFHSGVPIISTTKGLVRGGIRPSVALQRVFPQSPILVFSGPNISTEIQAQIPTIGVLAHPDMQIVQSLESLFLPPLSAELSTDLIGVEWAGILKNLVAITAGIIEGLALGNNLKGCLVSRATIEIRDWIVDHGGDPSTVF